MVVRVAVHMLMDRDGLTRQEQQDGMTLSRHGLRLRVSSVSQARKIREMAAQDQTRRTQAVQCYQRRGHHADGYMRTGMRVCPCPCLR